MRKIFGCLCIVCLTVFFVGCKKEVSYNFMQAQSEINVIEIVKIGEPDVQGVNEQTILCTIDDITLFMEKFNELECYDHFGDPIGVYPDMEAIKIVYNNGEYELITPYGQAEYTQKRKYRNYVGYRSFDNKEFENLVSQYIDK